MCLFKDRMMMTDFNEQSLCGKRYRHSLSHIIKYQIMFKMFSAPKLMTTILSMGIRPNRRETHSDFSSIQSIDDDKSKSRQWIIGSVDKVMILDDVDSFLQYHPRM